MIAPWANLTLRMCFQPDADISLGPYILSPVMEKSVKTRWPLLLQDFVIIHGMTNQFQSAGAFTLVSMYSPLVWSLIFFCLMTLPVLAWYLARFTIADQGISLGDHWLTFVEQLLLEAPAVRYKSSSLRVLFGGWMLSALVFSMLASAVLKSAMSVAAPTPRLETAADILARKPEHLTVAILAGGGILEILEKADFKPLNDLGKFLVRSNGLLSDASQYSSRAMLKRLEAGALLYILPCEMIGSFLYYSIESIEDMEGYVYCSEGPLLNFHLGWVSSRVTDELHELVYREMERRYRWMAESPTRFLRHYEVEHPKLSERILNRQEKNSQQSIPQPLGQDEIAGTLLLFAISSSFSALIFFAEVLTAAGRHCK